MALVLLDAPVSVHGADLLRVKTALGEPEDDGCHRPVGLEGSEHESLRGSVIAAVGRRGIREAFVLWPCHREDGLRKV